MLCAVSQDLHYNSNRQTVGIVYVTREASSTDAGFTLMITFVTNQGDLPLLVADVSAVTPLTTATAVVTEFIKGFANSFTVEPRKANGELVKVGIVETRMPPPPTPRQFIQAHTVCTHCLAPTAPPLAAPIALRTWTLRRSWWARRSSCLSCGRLM